MSNESLDFSKLTDENKIRLVGIVTTVIVACIGGMFVLMAAFIQRPAPSTSPAPVVVIVTASPFPTLPLLPTSTLEFIQPTLQPTLTPPEQPTSNTATPSNNKFYVPWSNWIIDFVVFMPQDTWIALILFFGALFLVAGAAVFFSAKISSDFRMAFMYFAIILTFIFSIIKWGWWGVLWGFLLIYPVIGFLAIKYLFGATVGAISGILIGSSLSLFYMTWIGYLNKEFITSWSVVGFLIGMVIGIIFIQERALDI